ncbi:MAG: SPFH domain-containing protein [Clostridia bacterium]|nr:SPFH domain-containing protein [Clostridia bacterium]
MFKKADGTRAYGRIVAFALVAIIVLGVALGCYTTVPAGHTGVVLNFGRVQETVLGEGLNFKIPFVQNVMLIDNRIVKLDVRTESFSKDLQSVEVDVAVNYNIRKDAGSALYRDIGMNYEDVLITPAVNEVLKAVTARYTAVELVANRSEVSVLLTQGLVEKLSPYGISIRELNIINWDFSAEYISAVEAKQVAEQNLIKTRTEQEQALVIANTEAQKRVIAAEAQANEIKMLAEATAESNRTIAESLSDELIRYRTVDKWDGMLPSVVGSGTTPMIDISGLTGIGTNPNE